MTSVHIAITQQVKPGAEKEYEQALREFARESLREPGTTGVHLIAPVPGCTGCEYGILRSFESEEASRAFYASELFRDWERRATVYAAKPPIRRRLHGLEAFFRGTGQVPPRWKMAVVTWLGVFPTVLFWSLLLSRFLSGVPAVLLIAIMNVLAVITLTWGVMPLLTRIFAPWLRSH